MLGEEASIFEDGDCNNNKYKRSPWAFQFPAKLTQLDE